MLIRHYGFCCLTRKERFCDCQGDGVTVEGGLSSRFADTSYIITGADGVFCCFPESVVTQQLVVSSEESSTDLAR